MCIIPYDVEMCQERVLSFRCLQKDFISFNSFPLFDLSHVLKKSSIVLPLRHVYVKYNSCHCIKKYEMYFILLEAPITI